VYFVVGVFVRFVRRFRRASAATWRKQAGDPRAALFDPGFAARQNLQLIPDQQRPSNVAVFGCTCDHGSAHCKVQIVLKGALH
jgi:hypothetical protein